MYETRERAYYEDSLFRIHLLNVAEVSSHAILEEVTLWNVLLSLRELIE